MDAELTDEEKETEWPLFTLEELAYKDLSPAMLNGRGIKARECLMWREFIPHLAQIAGERGSPTSQRSSYFVPVLYHVMSDCACCISAFFKEPIYTCIAIKNVTVARSLV